MAQLAKLISRFEQLTMEELWQQIINSHIPDEDSCLKDLLAYARPAESTAEDVATRAVDMVEEVRRRGRSLHMLDALLQEYSLDTQEGIMLMCLAEALMRIPDKKTADALIEDRLSAANWNSHLGKSNSLFVNASTWGLLLSGRMIGLEQSLEADGSEAGGLLNNLLKRTSEPMIRGALAKALKIMSNQFVLGNNITEALSNAEKYRAKGYRYSFDMLGEAALTAASADKYFNVYYRAIEEVASDAMQQKDPGANTISIKLSALHPRFQASQQPRVMTELFSTALKLIAFARSKNVPVTIDAEEADRLELSLRLFAELYRSEPNRGWGRLGLAVQAYSHRALPVLMWLTALAREGGDSIPVRLVKGAYWDSEIKLAQQKGLAGYPVFTRKEGTDVSYLACMKYLLSEATRDLLYPQFATHNAHTVAAVLEQAKITTGRAFEFQRLHGMGDALYHVVLKNTNAPVRIYAPVGDHKDLLPYLVRRLLENGANTSFVHRLLDTRTSVGQLVQHPVNLLARHQSLRSDQIPLPVDIFRDRANSMGVNLASEADLQELTSVLNEWDEYYWEAGPIINGEPILQQADVELVSPYDHDLMTGSVLWSKSHHLEHALDWAEEGFNEWHKQEPGVRADYLDKLAELLEDNRIELIHLCCREAGKTLQDSIDEVREAVDFCRYYAGQARTICCQSILLPGVTGETNRYYLEGKGIFVCISPWNFPLAIFIGQLSAALVTGNAVIAKPAEQTSLVAFRAAELVLEAGISPKVFQFLPGEGHDIGPLLLDDPRITGVAFTGSLQTAQLINLQLAQRPGPIATFIAETGGQNAMIADSTALPEQVVKDVMHSAFASAGQRCSALRVLFIQEEAADHVLSLLAGAMVELSYGPADSVETDIGPVIDVDAQQSLFEHIGKMSAVASWQVITELPDECSNGTFVPACAFEIERMDQLEEENFGPVLHIIRFSSEALDEVIEQINHSNFGLTLSIHSRNESVVDYIENNVRVGNTYINRHQVGAMVGAQPFGGLGLSGTGPKAGGPQYLYRFMVERTSTNNIAALGGNATLLTEKGPISED